MTTVDLSPVLQWVLGIMSAVVTVAIPIIVPFLLKRWGVANGADQQQQLEVLLSAGAGKAYKYALKYEEGLKSVPVQDASLQHGIQYVMEKAPAFLKALGWTQEAVAAGVEARLGKLLAEDPTVTAGQPDPIPTTRPTPSPSPTQGPVAPPAPTPAPLVLPPVVVPPVGLEEAPSEPLPDVPVPPMHYRYKRSDVEPIAAPPAGEIMP